MISFNKNNWIFTLFFILTKFCKYRKLLKQCLINNNFAQEFSIDQIISLDLNSLKNNNIEVLVLDYDGVLCEQGEIKPLPQVIAWLERALLVFGEHKIFILSNNPLLARQEFFNKYFNNQIIFIKNKPKPYPDGIAEIYDYLQSYLGRSQEKSHMLIIDDRLSTGILAAKIFGIASCLVLNPYTNIRKQFVIEYWFIFLRKLERLIIWHS